MNADTVYDPGEVTLTPSQLKRIEKEVKHEMKTEAQANRLTELGWSRGIKMLAIVGLERTAHDVTVWNGAKGQLMMIDDETLHCVLSGVP